MCQICDDLHATIRIEHPYQYYEMVSQIKTMLQDGILVLIEGNCDFNQVDRNKPFPDDVPYHVFKCACCESRFGLCVETYHGGGGSWGFMHD